MESHNFSIKIACPIHPTEFIQRVHTETNAHQQLFCLECILQHEDSSSISSQLKTIPDLVNTAANFYAQNKQTTTLSTEIPPEYQDLVSQQGEKLEKLNHHIEEEKKKVSNIFDIILQDTVKMISDKKNEYLHKLDQQLFNLRYWYIYFDKQLKKAYPSEEDIPFLYPTKDELVNKLGKITNSTQLLAFVRNLKEDLNEKKIGMSENLERGRQTKILKLSKDLLEVQDIKPFYEQGETTLSDFKTEVQSKVTELLDKMFNLSNSIRDVTTSNFSSNFVTLEEFQMVREWLPKDISSFEPKLLYSAKRDGLDANKFHKICDGKKNTLTFIKAEFTASHKTFTIGGYLDSPWKMDSAHYQIPSTKAFIFNTTLKVKTPVKDTNLGAYGSPGHGPIFGQGDIAVLVPASSNESFVYPISYEDTRKIVDAKDFSDSSKAKFTPKEVEIYILN